MIGKTLVGQTGNRYEIVRKIGRGGFAVVYQATSDDGASVAVKVFTSPADRSAIESFAQEVRGLASLHHENLLEILDYGRETSEADSPFFVVTPYCEEGDYRKRLAQYAHEWPGHEVLIADARQVLNGLGALHGSLVHRDLKPENVLISSGTFKICDFGLSKFVDEMTRSVTFKDFGTASYTAPELWLGQRASPASDFYALGIMLFEAVAGYAPLVGDDAIQLREKHLYELPPRLRTLKPEVPVFLDDTVARLLAKRPTLRHQTAREVLEALTPRPPASDPRITGMAENVRQRRERDEARRIKREREAVAARQATATIQEKESEVVSLIDSVVGEINSQLGDAGISKSPGSTGIEYRLGSRAVAVVFFPSGAIFSNPRVPGRMEILKERRVIHGGYLEIRQGGQGHEGWNLVLLDSDSPAWQIVETRVSVLSRRGRPEHEPIATEANLFADNLACHWMGGMHTFNLTDKALERSDIIRIFDHMIQ